MKFYADLHIHSRYSRSTSPELDHEHIALWSLIKGIHVISTGDFTHPAWMAEIQKKLEPAEPGFFTLKKEFQNHLKKELPPSCQGQVRFVLSTEISNIYKRQEKVRKVHNVVLAQNLESALKFQKKLGKIGNIQSDGRPILGLDSRDLLEMALDAGEKNLLIPAHIWTPWFSVLGSRGGFDRIKDCFGDLTSHIFAVETGLSSDPPMNWRLSQLDPYALISCSDAHSPQKIARESTIFDTEMSYAGIYRALSDPKDRGLLGTVEFFPEEGKYHYDGHRNCQTRLTPKETIKLEGLCPKCGKPVTVGVMARVEELADHPEGRKSKRWRPYQNLIPLVEIIAEARGTGTASKSVQASYWEAIRKLGNEMSILGDAPLEDITKVCGSLIAEGIRRVRQGQVHIAAGYDGEYGTIEIFTEQERETAQEQMTLF